MSLWHLAVAMAFPVTGLLVAALRETRAWYLVLKPLASVLFVVAGALFLPLPEKPAVLLLVGLVLSFVGDVLLIPKGRKLTFLLGLGFFLCAHVAYGIAFLVRGVDGKGVAIAGAVLVGAAIPLARGWLLPHVQGAMRPPVLGYVAAITAMVALSAGAFAAGARLTLPLGAFVFYLSDLCVARERFVARSVWNGVVGLPLYYASQLLLVDGMR
jgi:uncharacterized membrane protein YhhN